MNIDALLCPIFGDQGRPLRSDDCPQSVRGWDSLKQIQLLVTIEETYGIELTTAEIMSLRTVGMIVEVLRRRGLEVTFASA